MAKSAQKDETQNPESKWFGYQSVQSEEKQGMVDDVFHSVAQKYDLMNDTMSFGMHRLWKNRLIREIRPKSTEKFLDVAGGTGDIAFRIFERTHKKADITIYDINQSMLNVGQDRAIDKGYGDEAMSWICGNAETLPFEDNSFDVYTIAFGLRNVAHIDNALAEARRVLKPGGRFFCMEFSHVDNPLIRKFYDMYSEKLIPSMGQAITNDRESYQYLIESIRQFPRPENLKSRLVKSGFSNANYTKLSHGIVCIHKAF